MSASAEYRDGMITESEYYSLQALDDIDEEEVFEDDDLDEF